MNIQIISKENINQKLWDECIEQCAYGRIYATTTYLNAMCSNWKGLVANDYSYIMPLPCNTKFGIEYNYIPAFTQQLGIYGKEVVDEKNVHEFIKAIPKKYSYSELSFNAQNTVTKGEKRINYIMPLSDNYETLKSNYSRQAKRNIAKAIEENIIIKENVSVDNIIAIHRKRFNDKIGSKPNEYERFGKLCSLLISKNKCLTVGAFKNNELIAGSIYLIFNNRITFILNGNSNESLQLGASHLLKDYIIKKFATTEYILDFEGSETESFARFYQQFGAKEIEYYTYLVINKLPFYLSWLKPKSN